MIDKPPALKGLDIRILIIISLRSSFLHQGFGLRAFGPPKSGHQSYHLTSIGPTGLSARGHQNLLTQVTRGSAMEFYDEAAGFL